MEDTVVRFLKDVFPRIDGPFGFRIFLQPTIAIIFAIRDGLKDARLGKPAYFRALFTRPDIRGELLRSGWKSVSKVFFVALGLEFVYEIIVLRWFYPVEALIVATVLALLPYVVIRGSINRMSKKLSNRDVVPREYEESVGAQSAKRSEDARN